MELTDHQITILKTYIQMQKVLWELTTGANLGKKAPTLMGNEMKKSAKDFSLLIVESRNDLIILFDSEADFNKAINYVKSL